MIKVADYFGLNNELFYQKRAKFEKTKSVLDIEIVLNTLSGSCRKSILIDATRRTSLSLKAFDCEFCFEIELFGCERMCQNRKQCLESALHYARNALHLEKEKTYR